MKQKPKKVKMGKYISISITALIVFITTWALSEVIWDKSQTWVKYAFIALAFVMLIYFTSIAIGVFSYSLKAAIKLFKNFKHEKGLWKILTLVFRIAMLLFGIVIAVLWLVWTILMIKDGLVGTYNMKQLGFSWTDRMSFVSMAYLSGLHDVTGVAADVVYNLYDLNKNAFGILVTSFVFILIWAAAGIAFEILKRIFGGYRPKKKEDDEEKELAKA